MDQSMFRKLKRLFDNSPVFCKIYKETPCYGVIVDCGVVYGVWYPHPYYGWCKITTEIDFEQFDQIGEMTISLGMML